MIRAYAWGFGIAACLLVLAVVMEIVQPLGR